MQVAASYGVHNQSAAGVTAGQLAPSQAALAAQGLAQQSNAAAHGVVHVPYPQGGAGAQQFQMNGQPTTLAL
jgi:hypothetical protein